MNYTPLEPSFIQPLGLDTIGGGITSLLASTTFLYGAGIMLVIVAAAFRYGLAGIWRIEASSRGITKSNQEIKRVTFGLIGVLSLFLLISSVNRDLLRGDVGLNNLGGGVGASPTTSNTSAASTTHGSGAGSPGNPSTNGSEQSNRGVLRNAGIVVISTSGQTTPCTPQQLEQPKPSCTNLEGMPSSVISMLLQLKTTCGTTLTVTGGTEPGHKSHGPGKAAVDVDDNNSTLNACIRKFSAGPVLGFCTATFSNFGFLFCDERGTSHWHIFK